jgi:hypothetical protein
LTLRSAPPRAQSSQADGARATARRRASSAETRREALERLLDSEHPDAKAFFERALKK